MTRVKRGVTTKRRHNRRIKSTKGFRGLRSKIYTQANIAWMKAGLHAYEGRKNKKRDFRQLWIARISAAIKEINAEYKYSRFINKLNTKQIGLNRKVLSEMAINNPEAFKNLVIEIMAD
jgi:large subunit ribosomal protein L20